jgi:hypothetical protein
MRMLHTIPPATLPIDGCNATFCPFCTYKADKEQCPHATVHVLGNFTKYRADQHVRACDHVPIDKHTMAYETELCMIKNCNVKRYMQYMFAKAIERYPFTPIANASSVSHNSGNSTDGMKSGSIFGSS